LKQLTTTEKMQIKKYIARTIQEGKVQILEELGPDAVILSTRKSKPNSKGEAVVEIVAAIDKKNVDSDEKVTAEPTNVGKKIASQFDYEKQDRPSNNHNNEQLRRIELEISSMKAMMKDLANAVKFKLKAEDNPTFIRLQNRLLKAGFNEKEVFEYIAELTDKYPEPVWETIYSDARSKYEKLIEIHSTIEVGEERKVVMFYGSTGCGKTSSLVKLGIITKLTQNARVLFISADTKKVGGAEQLQTYAGIAGIPFMSAYSPKELKDILDREVSYDLVLIDTNGKSHRDLAGLNDLEKYINAANPDYGFLTLSLTHSSDILSEEIISFKSFRPRGLILTKLDEGNIDGRLIEAIYAQKLPVYYISQGQKIPEDIEPADTEMIINVALPK